jgi:hypothetical protein
LRLRTRCFGISWLFYTPAELVAFAEENGVENASTMREQELMFAILKQLAIQETDIVGEGVVATASDSSAHRTPITWLRRLHGRVRLANHDRWFMILLYRWFPSILQVLTIIGPETLAPDRQAHDLYLPDYYLSFCNGPRVNPSTCEISVRRGRASVRGRRQAAT